MIGFIFIHILIYNIQSQFIFDEEIRLRNLFITKRKQIIPENLNAAITLWKLTIFCNKHNKPLWFNNNSTDSIKVYQNYIVPCTFIQSTKNSRSSILTKYQIYIYIITYSIFFIILLSCILRRRESSVYMVHRLNIIAVSLWFLHLFQVHDWIIVGNRGRR